VEKLLKDPFELADYRIFFGCSEDFNQPLKTENCWLQEKKQIISIQ